MSISRFSFPENPVLSCNTARWKEIPALAKACSSSTQKLVLSEDSSLPPNANIMIYSSNAIKNLASVAFLCALYSCASPSKVHPPQVPQPPLVGCSSSLSTPQELRQLTRGMMMGDGAAASRVAEHLMFNDPHEGVLQEYHDPATPLARYKQADILYTYYLLDALRVEQILSLCKEEKTLHSTTTCEVAQHYARLSKTPPYNIWKLSAGELAQTKKLLKLPSSSTLFGSDVDALFYRYKLLCHYRATGQQRKVRQYSDDLRAAGVPAKLLDYAYVHSSNVSNPKLDDERAPLYKRVKISN